MGATKLSKEQIKDLKDINISGVTTEEAANEKLIAYLAENDIDGVEDEDFDSLLGMAVVIFEGSDDEMDQAADEVEEKPTKKSKKVEEPEEEEDEDEDEDEEPTEEEMRAALVKAGTKKKDAAALKGKKLIAAFEALSEDEEEDEDEDDSDDEDESEEEEAPAPKKADKKAVKEEAKKPEPKKADKKPVAKTTEKRVSKKISPLTDEEDAAKFDKFKTDLTKLLKGHDVNFNFIANGGLSVRIVGKNSSKVILSYDTPKYDKQGHIIASVFIPTKDEELLAELFGEDIEIKTAWNGALHATNLTFDDVISAFKENQETLDKIVSTIIKKDEKLGKNREKMENDLKEDKKSKVEAMKGKTKAKAEEPKKSDKKSDKKKKK